MKVRQRRLLNSKDKKQMFTTFQQVYGEAFDISFGKKDEIEYIRLENKEEIYAINGKAAFLILQDMPIPMVSYLATDEFPIKNVIVDAGAVKFIVSGADVMRPGIVEIDPNIKENEPVVIRDINHRKPLAIGLTLFNAEDMKNMSAGKVIKSIHHVGDNFYVFAKDLK
jgi:PUA domain protein